MNASSNSKNLFLTKENAISLFGIIAAFFAIVIFIWLTFFDVRKLSTPLSSKLSSTASSEPFIYSDGLTKVMGRQRIYDPFDYLDRTVESSFIHPEYGNIDLSIDFKSKSNEADICFEDFNFKIDLASNELLAFSSSDGAQNLSDKDVIYCAQLAMNLLNKKYLDYIDDKERSKENASNWEVFIPEFIENILYKA